VPFSLALTTERMNSSPWHASTPVCCLTEGPTPTPKLSTAWLTWRSAEYVVPDSMQWADSATTDIPFVPVLDLAQGDLHKMGYYTTLAKDMCRQVGIVNSDVFTKCILISHIDQSVQFSGKSPPFSSDHSLHLPARSR